jgi:SOS response regulatory protein OraA/RecX
MHGQQTMKYLNDKAVADAIMAKHSETGYTAQQAKDIAEALAKKAAEKAAA